MRAIHPIFKTWDRLNHLLFWGAFVVFWILLAVLIQDAKVKNGEGEQASSPSAFELG